MGSVVPVAHVCTPLLAPPAAGGNPIPSALLHSIANSPVFVLAPADIDSRKDARGGQAPPYRSRYHSRTTQSQSSHSPLPVPSSSPSDRGDTTIPRTGTDGAALASALDGLYLAGSAKRSDTRSRCARDARPCAPERARAVRWVGKCPRRRDSLEELRAPAARIAEAHEVRRRVPGHLKWSRHSADAAKPT